jgi:hypothetical protein
MVPFVASFDQLDSLPIHFDQRTSDLVYDSDRFVEGRQAIQRLVVLEYLHPEPEKFERPNLKMALEKEVVLLHVDP